MSVQLRLNISKGLRWPLFRPTLKPSLCLLQPFCVAFICKVQIHFCKLKKKGWEQLSKCEQSCHELVNPFKFFFNSFLKGLKKKKQHNSLWYAKLWTPANKIAQQSSSVPFLSLSHDQDQTSCALFLPNPPSTLCHLRKERKKNHYWIIYVVQIKAWTLHTLYIPFCAKALFFNFF